MSKPKTSTPCATCAALYQTRAATVGYRIMTAQTGLSRQSIHARGTGLCTIGTEAWIALQAVAGLPNLPPVCTACGVLRSPFPF